ncbi:hypothetical protein PMZ80_010834 [Knufia obscura]|uniref:Dynamin family protein n=1 Tax=Knufia obscura TaxID=1635080 RepID=A0ABR0R8D0_9EURO|nr:hypothetical protein PMZ80_010834 [Knufia obscura]
MPIQNEPAAPSKGGQINIQSKAHERLLNVIDDLRSQGISRFIDLPQLIVCGDQSSGKSSVLEAVSGIKFPTKDALCTRFATELILRRNPEVASLITIVPDANRPEDEKNQLSLFKSEASVHDDFGSIIDQASAAMGLDASKKFSSDVLRIELSGPQQPHLTLVDLPGLFHSGSKSQSDQDAEAVKALVTGYMKKSRSIILAVVSAKNDFNNQIVTKYAKEFDKGGMRTLGIITKPDTLPAGSDSEKQFFELAENKDVYFRLGWHVLRNRDYEHRDCSNEERDVLEKEFFSKGIWTSLSPTQLGIDPLKPRLSRVLQGQILSELPSLIRDVESGMQECQGRLDRLGASRGTKQEQRLHLHAVSDNFTNIVKEAINGKYDGEYFGDAAEDEGYAKRIRAVTTNKLEEFAEDVRRKGHKYQVVETVLEDESKVTPIHVTKEARIERVKELIRRNRDKELSTTTKEDTITTLFREQCSPWVGIANRYAEDIFDAVKYAVLMALETTCDQATRDGVLSYIVNPALIEIKKGFDAAVTKTLRQHVSGHPMTFNHYFTENIQRLRKEHSEEQMSELLKEFFGKDPRTDDCVTESREVNTKSLLQALLAPNEANMTLFACSEALHVMEAYYKVALKYFTDDFAISAVEQALLTKVESLFSPAAILTLEEDLIEDIAGETEESKLERTSSTQKLGTLKQALDVLKRLDRGNVASMSPISLLSGPEPKENLKLTPSDRRDEVLTAKAGAADTARTIAAAKREVEANPSDVTKACTRQNTTSSKKKVIQDNAQTAINAQANVAYQESLNAIEQSVLTEHGKEVIREAGFAQEHLLQYILPGFEEVRKKYRSNDDTGRAVMRQQYENMPIGPEDAEWYTVVISVALQCMNSGEWE